MALESIKQTLFPLRTIAWGDLAIGSLGVPTVICSYMFVIPEANMNEATQKLHDAGFIHTPWSFGSAVDPSTVADNPALRKLHENVAIAWASIDRNCIRFNLPADSGFPRSRVILFSTSYVQLALPTSDSDPNFHVEENLYYPKVYPLLKSIAKLQANGDTSHQWQNLLDVWAISYLWGHLHLPDDILDSCGDEDVIRWFHTKIRPLSR